MDAREIALRQWLGQQKCLDGLPAWDAIDLHPLCGDASMRRYFRLKTPSATTYIAVDTPLAASNFAGFVSICDHWQQAGIPVPKLLSNDDQHGFMLLEDLGDTTLLSVLGADNVDEFYQSAINALLDIQTTSAPQNYALPQYDKPMLLREMEIFREWLLVKFMGFELTSADQELLDTSFNCLADAALEQPSVVVHRDYHSRNLMVTEQNQLAVIDFQDAVSGPVSYDLVSLLKDCYVRWPTAKRQYWLASYLQHAIQKGLLTTDQAAAFSRWFDLMGAQRHLKAAGIFARLQARDGKPGYLGDIPRTLGYITELADYPELAELAGWIRSRVLPAMAASEYFAEYRDLLQ